MPENDIGYFFVAIKRQAGPIFVYTYTCAFGNAFVYTFFFHFAMMLSLKQDKCYAVVVLLIYHLPKNC